MAKRPLHHDVWFSWLRLSRGAKFQHERVFWALWFEEPKPDPWITPRAVGFAPTREAALLAAEPALRAVGLGDGAAVRNMHPSFAAAAWRESKGRPPAWCMPSAWRPKVVLTPEQEAESEARFQAWLDGPGRLFRLLRDLEHDAWIRGAIPATEADALAYFGLGANATAGEVRRAFRRRALVEHPDRGGDAAAFRVTKQLYDLALAFVELR
jgi:hypothetical protein